MNNRPVKKDPESSAKTRKYPETGYSKAVFYYRRQLELTQEELANACGVRKNQITAIETGETQKPRADTIKTIVIGLQSAGLDISIDDFDRKVAEYEVVSPPTPVVYEPTITQAKDDLTEILILLPSTCSMIDEIERTTNSKQRVVRGLRNVLKGITGLETASLDSETNLKTLSDLIKRFDCFIQEESIQELCERGMMFPLRDFRQKLSGFQKAVGEMYKHIPDGQIPNDWPIDEVKHKPLLDELFDEIAIRRDFIEDRPDLFPDATARKTVFDTLLLLEIELDSNPLKLKQVDAVRQRLEQLDRDVFKDLIIISQLLLGTYASQLPPGSVFRDAKDSPEMVVIPAGKFQMGSPDDEEGRYDDEGPQHEVNIGYRLAVGRYPVTFEEWDLCVSGGGTDYKPEDEGWGRDQRPVINVSWNDIQPYLTWLSEQTGQTYRLLSEAEWEYSCRAGETTRFCFGDKDDQLGDYAWYDQNSDSKTQPVGMKRENDFGLYDVHGNVYEWVEDQYQDSYTDAPKDGSAWIDTSSSNNEVVSRVVRGGSWDFEPRYLRSANRGNDGPTLRNYVIGFRLSRTL